MNVSSLPKLYPSLLLPSPPPSLHPFLPFPPPSFSSLSPFHCRYLLPPGNDEFDAYITVMASTHSLAQYWGAYGIIQEIVIILLIFR